MKTHSGRLYTCEMHIQSAEAQKYAKSRLSGMLSIPEFTEKDFFVPRISDLDFKTSISMRLI